jgi:hypothetical protein
VLTKPEAKDLARLEKVIANALESIQKDGADIGRALCQIRDGHLYRGTHHSFELYVRERFDLNRRSAYHFLDWGYLAEKCQLDFDGAEEARQLVASLPPELRAAVRDSAQAMSPEEIGEVSKFLALSRQERVSEVNRREEESRKRTTPPRESNAAAIDQGQRLLRRAIKVFQRVGPEAEEVIGLLEQALKKTAAL